MRLTVTLLLVLFIQPSLTWANTANPLISQCSILLHMKSSDGFATYMSPVIESLNSSDKTIRDKAEEQLLKFTKIAEGTVNADIKTLMDQNPFLALYVLSEHFNFGFQRDVRNILKKQTEKFFEKAENPTDLTNLDNFNKAVETAIGDVSGPKTVSHSMERDRSLKARLSQIKKLPQRMRELREIVDRELSIEKMDEYLYSLRGFHAHPGVSHYNARTYPRPSIVASVKPEHIDMDVREFLDYVLISMEIEDPIEDYSKVSGNTLRFILPNLARFMGSTDERYSYLEENGKRQWCESTWCREESRHGGTWAKIYQKLTGVKPDRDNPNDVQTYSLSEEDGLQHLLSRLTTEWNASTTYYVIANRTKGPLREAIFNLIRDEFKHLTIASSAHKYLYGTDHTARVFGMMKVAYGFLNGHVEERSTGAGMAENKLSVIEFAYAHLLTEKAVRRYLDTVPLEVLREIFDGDSQIQPLPVTELSDETKAKYEAFDKAQEQKRKGLQRWSPKQKAEALELEKFIKDYKTEIGDIIAGAFNKFKGAEFYSSPKAQQIREQIQSLSIGRARIGSAIPKKEHKLLKKALLEALRTYQIKNNWFIQERAKKN